MAVKEYMALLVMLIGLCHHELFNRNIVMAEFGVQIVNGVPAGIHDNPWQVSIQVKFSGGNFTHECGGSIIANKWIVTARHCEQNIMSLSHIKDCSKKVNKSKGRNKKVNKGKGRKENGKDRNKKGQKEQTFIDCQENRGNRNVRVGFGQSKLSEMTVFRNVRRFFIPYGNYEDIALIELRTPVEYGPGIGRVPIADPAVNFTGKSCGITGWGKTATSNISNHLQYIRLPVISNFQCRNEYRNSIKNTEVCAKNNGNLPKDSCQGDSGGPLICEAGGQMQLVGATSHGNDPCNGATPTVHARVPEFISWIESITGPL